MITNSEIETFEFAKEFSKKLIVGDVIAIAGNLGAGKTIFSKGICEGLGYRGLVNSPTYTIVHEYPHSPPIYHLDLYRLTEHSSLDEIGFDQYYFKQGITLIEWPERLGKGVIELSYWVQIQHSIDEQREIRVLTKDFPR
ncbi:MAG: tRNA (adenosine(37)-N6)-threonylcarbamoyltransferase complex ATPase subunit type 1 TsaE [Fibrobacter sp.]|jgi:tRNA threonylcarbamoyladenosine biosynthesis protein TsaE|nr:tRNA (adenosine(37)-N6)-threonylcarbamoyltransferase complex ATPase subunit type 1 TsaE [Fibrobacter sp.]